MAQTSLRGLLHTSTDTRFCLEGSMLLEISRLGLCFLLQFKALQGNTLKFTLPALGLFDRYLP